MFYRIFFNECWSHGTLRSYKTCKVSHLFKGNDQKKGVYKDLRDIRCEENGAPQCHHQEKQPSKIHKRAMQKLPREAARSPTATLKELQEHLTSNDYSLHMTTISCILHMSRLYRESPFSQKPPSLTKSPQVMWQNVLCSENNVKRSKNFHNSKNMLQYML